MGDYLKYWTIQEKLEESTSIHQAAKFGKSNRYKANKGFRVNTGSKKFNFIGAWMKRFGHCETIEQVISQSRKPIL